MKKVSSIPEKVPVPPVPSLSIVRNTPPPSSNKKEIINNNDCGRSNENNSNQSTRSNIINNNDCNGKINNNNDNDDINNINNDNNKHSNIDSNNNNNNLINSITSSPKIKHSIPPFRPSSSSPSNPLPPTKSTFYDTKESAKLSSFYDSNMPISSTSLPFFDSKNSSSSNEFSSGDVSRSSSGIIYGNWTEVYDSPGVNLNLNLKKLNNLHGNDSECGYENKNEKRDGKLFGEEKERNEKSDKKNEEGGKGGGGGIEIEKKEREREREMERKREEKKEDINIDNWMDTAIDKNHYEKRKKENYYNYINRKKSIEKQEEKRESGKYGNSSITGNKNRVCDIIPKQVVLYYCSVLIAGMPGIIYITQTLLCFSSLTTKDCFFLNNLDRVKIIEKNEKKDKKTPNLLSSLLSLPPSSSRYPILFSFFSGTREITVLPLTISSDQLQSVIIQVKNSFHSIYFTE